MSQQCYAVKCTYVTITVRVTGSPYQKIIHLKMVKDSGIPRGGGPHGQHKKGMVIQDFADKKARKIALTVICDSSSYAFSHVLEICIPFCYELTLPVVNKHELKLITVAFAL